MQILELLNNLILKNALIARLTEEGYYYLVLLFLFFTVSVVAANFLAFVVTMLMKAINLFFDAYVAKTNK